MPHAAAGYLIEGWQDKYGKDFRTWKLMEVLHFGDGGTILCREPQTGKVVVSFPSAGDPWIFHRWFFYDEYTAESRLAELIADPLPVDSPS